MVMVQQLQRLAYTDQDWFDKEMEQLFGNSWQFAGMASDIPDTGDYFTTKIGRAPVLIIRGSEGWIRGFHNTCRHRGTQILDGSGTLNKGVRCPYHNWFYGFDGKIIAQPDKKELEHHDRDSMGLHPVHCAVWRNMIFVHPDPASVPLQEWLDTLPMKMGPHKPELLYESPPEEYVINANWKIFCENYIDGYHLAHLHSKSLKEYDHSKQKAGFAGRHWTFFEPMSSSGKEHLKDFSRIPLIDHIPEEKIGAYVHLVFPNLGITETENMWCLVHIKPQAPDRTLVTIRTWTMPFSNLRYMFIKDTKNDEKKEKSSGRNNDRVKTGDVMEEDILICEAVQAAMSSPRFRVGPLHTRLERSLVEFQQNVADFIKS